MAQPHKVAERESEGALADTARTDDPHTALVPRKCLDLPDKDWGPELVST
jgi:hypothetical protein